MTRGRRGHDEPPQGSALPQARPITDTEWKRRQRAGGTQPDGRRRRFEHHLVWTEAPRNGLPWKPYVYRGAG